MSTEKKENLLIILLSAIFIILIFSSCNKTDAHSGGRQTGTSAALSPAVIVSDAEEEAVLLTKVNTLGM